MIEIPKSHVLQSKAKLEGKHFSLQGSPCSKPKSRILIIVNYKRAVVEWLAEVDVAATRLHGTIAHGSANLLEYTIFKVSCQTKSADRELETGD